MFHIHDWSLIRVEALCMRSAFCIAGVPCEVQSLHNRLHLTIVLYLVYNIRRFLFGFSHYMGSVDHESSCHSSKFQRCGPNR